MKLELSDHHIPVILAALEAFQRFRINQPQYALETIFPKKCWDLGWGKMAEICQPFHDAFFPDHPVDGGPGICSEEAGQEAHLAYEIEKTIRQYLALKKSGGWFGWEADFDGNLLNPSGLPSPKIDGLDEMQYMDFLIPDQKVAKNFYEEEKWSDLWTWIRENMPDLPSGGKMEIIENDPLGDIWRSASKLYVRVHKPRKKIDGQNF